MNTRTLLFDSPFLLGFEHTQRLIDRAARGAGDAYPPYNVEARMRERGAHYSKALLPFVSNAVVDGRLVTGQNPGSAKETAAAVAALL